MINEYMSSKETQDRKQPPYLAPGTLNFVFVVLSLKGFFLILKAVRGVKALPHVYC